MKAKINGLNRRILNNAISFDEYRRAAEKLLRSLDWQKRIQYENMLYL